MSVAKVTEVIASSPTSFEGAVQEGISRAGKTLKNIRSAWIKDQEVVVEDNRVTSYRVNMMITFVLED